MRKHTFIILQNTREVYKCSACVLQFWLFVGYLSFREVDKSCSWSVSLHNSTCFGTTALNKALKNSYPSTECSKLQNSNYFKCVIKYVIKLFFTTLILFVKKHMFFLKITSYLWTITQPHTSYKQQRLPQINLDFTIFERLSCASLYQQKICES